MLRHKLLRENESPEGEGVAAKKSKKMDINGQWSEPKSIGKAWPRKHNETDAMCDVDESGVEEEPQGVHVSKHAKAEDGITTAVGHDWPKQPKNKGGSAEKADGYSWKGGGELSGGGNTDPQLESWSPDDIAEIIEDNDISIQDLFDNYARNRKSVCLEDFQTLCFAHGMNIDLDDRSMLRLMDKNKEFVFYENGIGYLAVPISEDIPTPMNSGDRPQMGQSRPGMGGRGRGMTAGEGFSVGSDSRPSFGSNGSGDAEEGLGDTYGDDIGYDDSLDGGFDDSLDGGLDGDLDGESDTGPHDGLNYDGGLDTPDYDNVTDDDIMNAAGEFGHGDVGDRHLDYDNDMPERGGRGGLPRL